MSKVLGFAFGFGFLPMFGGNWNNGLNCGLWYWNLNNASSLSNVNVGGRLLIYYIYIYLHITFHASYCLKLDIKKFYPSIDKEILKRKFRKKIKCRNTLELIDTIIDSSTKGLPIRKLYFTMVCKFLFARFRPLHKRNITCKTLYKVYG